PPRRWLPRPPRPHREADPLGPAGRESQGRHGADQQLCHVPRLLRERPLLLQRKGPLLQRRQDRSRPARGLRRAEGNEPERGREMAGPELGGVIASIAPAYPYEDNSKTATR